MNTHPVARLFALACLVLASAATSMGSPGAMAHVEAGLNRAPMARMVEPPPEPVLWTTWGANQYALADDGEAIWIGATGGVLRWDKALRSYRRFTRVDGLPQAVVLAVAVDAAGNRWYGGDGGLSRLDADDRWTHFTASEIGLYANYVDALAIGASDTLYVSHGLPGGAITRRDADGTWLWFPNRETAVQADYPIIRQTRGHTRLWTVAGAEVWCGYRVFDGAIWRDRVPPGAVGEPLDMAVDSRNHVWALGQTPTVYEWDGLGWSEHRIWVTFTGKVTALTVTADDMVWVGLQQREGMPYVSETARISQLSGDASWSLSVSGPVAALLPTPEGLWAAGPGWLQLPSREIIIISDAPRFKVLPDALSDANGRVWLYSGYSEPYSTGAVQRFDDNGTAALHDDLWQVLPVDYRPYVGYCDWATAWERSTEGDVWNAGGCYWRFGSPHPIRRYRGENQIEYEPEAPVFHHDIFAQDESHIWFAAEGRIDSLDDAGTPNDTGDDVWRTYALPSAGDHPVIAVDAGGHPWYGDSDGLYRYDGSSWLHVYTTRGICDLAPAADGTMYAQLSRSEPSGCRPYAGEVLAVRVDGTVEWPRSIESLVILEPEAVRSAYRRNTLWAIAPDGALWTVAESERGRELRRRDAAGLRTYALPVDPGTLQRLEVDARNRVWLVANSELWRMSRPPDFSVDVQPDTWLLAPDRVRQGIVRIHGIEGYNGKVSLSAVEPPAGIAVRFGANPVAAGQSVSVTVEAAPDSLPAIHRLIIAAADEVLTHTVTLTVSVVSELRETYLPVVHK